MAATFVYVSNAEDGDIGTYRLLDSGELEPGARVAAAGIVMPMAVSPDRRFLFAASRSKPFTVHTYAIDRGHRRVEAAVDRAAGGELSVHHARPDRDGSCSARPTAPTS